jgi:hypothetical protein
MNVTFRVTPVQLTVDPTALEPPDPAGILTAPDPAASPGEKSAIPGDATACVSWVRIRALRTPIARSKGISAANGDARARGTYKSRKRRVGRAAMLLGI